MQGVSMVQMGARLVVKVFDLDAPRGLALFKAEHDAYEALSPLGLAPDFFAAWDGPEPKAGRAAIVTPRCEPFREYARHLTPTAAGRMVRERIDLLHRAGWAHRDLNLGNIVVDDGVVKFIDLEFACPADPRAKPYDLYGPEASGLAVPDPHAALGISVWWSTPRDYMLALERWFGPLAGLAGTPEPPPPVPV